MEIPPQTVVLRTERVSVVADVGGPGLPRILHWGADLGPIDAEMAAALAVAAAAGVPRGAVDEPVAVTLLPGQDGGWNGRPGIRGHRDGAFPHLRLRLRAPVTTTAAPDGGGSLVAVAADEQAGVSVRSELHLCPQGVLRVRHTVANTGPGAWTVDEVLSLLPVPGTATELLDFTGTWSHERVPQRAPLAYRLATRESRRGRTGHDATPLLIVGTPGFGFRTGEVWAAHVAWSGNHQHLADPQVEGVTLLGGGELLLPGEVRLAPGETYETPWTWFAYSGDGLDGLAARLHESVRARPSHPRGPRPVVLNTWEAVYFDHDLGRLIRLADLAAGIGVERFVLDDGWFLGRRDDRAGLGDWYVDPQVWPDGLHPLVGHVRSLGLEFGLWVEPEMVNPDSELARAHPEWLLVAPGRPALPARHQQVLDLARPEVFDYLLERLDSLVGEYGIGYLKWDHNRDLLEAVHDGSGGVHRQTLAAYRLMAALRERHPGLEIESCASGGARVDLGVLEHTDRVWASDSNDPLERQQIQRWTGQLIPPELIGAHVGPPVAHTTGRATGLGLRCATALFGHAGIEWDLTSCTPDELDQLRQWIALYRRLRPVLHSGAVVRTDHPDPAAWLHGVVAADRSSAAFAYVQLATPTAMAPPRLRFPGLDPERSYTLSLSAELRPPSWPGRQTTEWITRGSVTLSGVALESYGVAAPPLHPADAVVMELRAL